MVGPTRKLGTKGTGTKAASCFGHSKRLGLLRRGKLKAKRAQPSAATATQERAAQPTAEREASAPRLPESAADLPETVLRNVALEAVRVGNYYAEPEQQGEVLAYIGEQFNTLLADAKWMKKNAAKMKTSNGLTERYSVTQILAKRHEADGYDVFVQAREALFKKAAEDSAGKRESVEVDPSVYGELQEGLAEAAAAAAGDADPVGADELVELLEGCAKAGEVAAAVYCGERLEAVHEDGMPDDILDRAFEALKPLLRPSAAAKQPRLTGPWQDAGSRKAFGRLLDRLGRLRKDREVTRGGDAAERAARSAKGEDVLNRLCGALAPRLAADAAAAACRRRGPLVAEITRVCSEGGLSVSTPVSWDIVRVLEERGELASDGRDVWLGAGEAAKEELPKLADFAGEVELLDGLARERLERRKRRQKAREHASKRRRTAAP